MKAQDTSELFFEDARERVSKILDSESGVFFLLIQELAWERMQIAIGAVADAEAALKWTLANAKYRKAFVGGPIGQIHSQGVSAFVTACENLAKRHGARFAPPQQLRAA